MFKLITENNHWSSYSKEFTSVVLLRDEVINLNSFLNSAEYTGRPIIIKQFSGSGIGVNTIVFIVEPSGRSIPVADITDYDSW